MNPANRPARLSDLPLWRLIVMLDDAERTLGADSETTRTLARVVRERVGSEGGVATTPRQPGRKEAAGA